MDHKLEWIAYLVGALGTLAWKFCRYLYDDRKLWLKAHGGDEDSLQATKPWKPKRAALAWLFDDGSTENKASWIATAGIVWAAGGFYINQVGVDGMFGGALDTIPLHPGVAMAFGSIMEFLAPAAVKAVTSRVARAFGGDDKP